VSGLCKFDGPGKIDRIAGNPAYLIECMHPLCQIVIILPVLVPFPLLVKRFVYPAFGESFSNPQTSQSRMNLPSPGRESTDPAGTVLVVAVPAQRMMDLINETQGKFPVYFVMSLPEKSDVVAHGKCVGPQVTPRVWTHRIQSGLLGKVLHEFTGKRCGTGPVHDFFPTDSTLMMN
jgi:hypothetical protein